MYGAVIVAAGLASRMGEFKPLLKFGNMTIIERIVSTLKQAGIEQIVIITGNNAKRLENEVKGQGVVFLRNEKYATTQMLDSAMIGFTYLQSKCEKIIFTPADIPLYTTDTVKQLLSSSKTIAYPVYQGKRGHPICFQESIIQDILNYNGDYGLKGALRQFDDVEEFIVEDQGIIYDVDSKDDYQRLLYIHNHQLYRPQLDVMVMKENLMINDEVAMLMYLIDVMGSIKDASVKMNMSYSKALKLIKQLENQIKKDVVIRRAGGVAGGCASLSEDGKELLEHFRNFEKKLNELANDLFVKEFQDFLEE